MLRRLLVKELQGHGRRLLLLQALRQLLLHIRLAQRLLLWLLLRLLRRLLRALLLQRGYPHPKPWAGGHRGAQPGPRAL